MRMLIALTAAWFTVACGAARAPTVTTFDELPAALRAGQTVAVDAASGAQFRGPLVRVAADAIVLTARDQEIAIGRADTRCVAVCCDSLTNGALLGFAAGLGAGVVVMRGVVRSDLSTSVEQALLGLMATSAGGAALGAAIDAGIHQDRVVFVSPGPSAPFAMGERRSIRVTWSW